MVMEPSGRSMVTTSLRRCLWRLGSPPASHMSGRMLFWRGTLTWMVSTVRSERRDDEEECEEDEEEEELREYVDRGMTGKVCSEEECCGKCCGTFRVTARKKKRERENWEEKE